MLSKLRRALWFIPMSWDALLRHDSGGYDRDAEYAAWCKEHCVEVTPWRG